MSDAIVRAVPVCLGYGHIQLIAISHPPLDKIHILSGGQISICSLNRQSTSFFYKKSTKAEPLPEIEGEALLCRFSFHAIF